MVFSIDTCWKALENVSLKSSASFRTWWSSCHMTISPLYW